MFNSRAGGDAALLVAALVTVVVAGVLDLGSGRAVVVPIVNVPLPRMCAFQQIAGHDCPGCGLTRSFVSLADGDLMGAWSYNAAGPFVFAVIAFQIPYRTIQIWRRSRGHSRLGLCRESWVLGFLVTAVMAQWLVRSFGLWW
jgi:hypothetical protein